MGDGPICWKDVTDAVPMSPTSTGVTFTPDLAAIRWNYNSSVQFALIYTVVAGTLFS